MAIKLSTVLTMCFLGAVSANNGAGSDNGAGTDSANTDAMREVFFRSDDVHAKALVQIMSTMTSNEAVEVLKKSSFATPELMQVASMAVGNRSSFRKQKKGFGGLDGARKLLNDMIYESMKKYDAEIAKCTDYYSRQCAAMEACRSQITASNYIAANSRALILDSQATINRCEVDIPKVKLELKQHNLKCKHEIGKMNQRLKMVMGDIAVMTMILKMTDCEANKQKFVQMGDISLLHCTDQCTHKSFVKFNHGSLQSQIHKLQSTLSHEIVTKTFADLFEGIEDMESLEFIQTNGPIANKTKFNRKPVPKTKVPGNPCNDPSKGAPSAADKRAAKCSLGKSPQCYKLQERFLLIQAGIQDERDELLEQNEKMKFSCGEAKKTLETTIANDGDTLSNSQTKLATATGKEATAAETARNTATENSQLDADLVKQMKSCRTNYINYETEQCALKKIRGELYKMKGDGHSGFFQDCEVSKWAPETCTKECGKGGTQKLIRSVLTHPNGGTKCLPLAAKRSCNHQPCPVNCVLSTWSGWSKCSSACGGGVQQRVREVKTAMRNGGKPCGVTSETQSCNPQSCEKDCVLTEWTKWSACSKDCDGGTVKRQRFVKTAVEGAGKCAGAWSSKRLQYKECNMKRCQLAKGAEVKTCNKTLDLVLLLDGSGSLGKKGWTAEIEAANRLVSAFEIAGANHTKVQVAVILYSGPTTYGKVFSCVGQNKKKVDLEKVCGIKMVTHFTDDLKKVKTLISGLTWPKGSTLTSLALITAKAELPLGRKDARTNVVVFTDGRPLSFRKTALASAQIRKAARLLWVPVTQHAPLKLIKKWATRRWEENVVPVSDFDALKKPDVVTHIIANICPDEHPKAKFAQL